MLTRGCGGPPPALASALFIHPTMSHLLRIGLQGTARRQGEEPAAQTLIQSFLTVAERAHREVRKACGIASPPPPPFPASTGGHERDPPAYCHVLP